MFEFTEDERVYLKGMHAMSSHSQGREVLVGLTIEETAIYMEYSRAFLSGNRDRDNPYTCLINP